MSRHFHPGGHLNYGICDEDGSNTLLGGDGDGKEPKMIFVPRQRSRINVKGILANIFLPSLLFTTVYWVMCFKVHYDNPNLTWFVVFAAFCISALTACTAYSRKENGEDPSWYTYAAGACFTATIAATVFGYYVFFTETIKFGDYLTLNTYAAINPAVNVGQTVMDSGRVYFSHGVALDFKKTAGFKHGDTYCVVPIGHTTRGEMDKLATYDFWAVGVNCCEEPRKFHCGANVMNPQIRSGLRLMNPDQLPFFRLAVQQAEAAYGITAAHPVFYHWTQDPLMEIYKHKAQAVRFFVIGTFVFFISNFVCVITSVFAFAKLGRF